MLPHLSKSAEAPRNDSSPTKNHGPRLRSFFRLRPLEKTHQRNDGDITSTHKDDAFSLGDSNSSTTPTGISTKNKVKQTTDSRGNEIKVPFDGSQTGGLDTRLEDARKRELLKDNNEAFRQTLESYRNGDLEMDNDSSSDEESDDDDD
jgi:hypothetical protein